MAAKLSHKCCIAGGSSAFDIKINTVQNCSAEGASSAVDVFILSAVPGKATAVNSYLLPPRKIFQMVSANACPCASLVKPYDPAPPPREIVTIFPAAWHVSISAAKKSQSGRAVPGNAGYEETPQI